MIRNRALKMGFVCVAMLIMVKVCSAEVVLPGPVEIDYFGKYYNGKISSGWAPQGVAYFTVKYPGEYSVTAFGGLTKITVYGPNSKNRIVASTVRKSVEDLQTSYLPLPSSMYLAEGRYMIFLEESNSNDILNTNSSGTTTTTEEETTGETTEEDNAPTVQEGYFAIKATARLQNRCTNISSTSFASAESVPDKYTSVNKFIRKAEASSTIYKENYHWWSFRAESSYCYISLKYLLDATDPDTSVDLESIERAASDLEVTFYEANEDHVSNSGGGALEGTLGWSLTKMNWSAANDTQGRPPTDIQTPRLTYGKRYYVMVQARNGDFGAYQLEIQRSLNKAVDFYCKDIAISRTSIPDSGATITVQYTYGMSGYGTARSFYANLYAASSERSLITQSWSSGAQSEPLDEKTIATPNSDENKDRNRIKLLTENFRLSVGWMTCILTETIEYAGQTYRVYWMSPSRELYSADEDVNDPALRLELQAEVQDLMEVDGTYLQDGRWYGGDWVDMGWDNNWDVFIGGVQASLVIGVFVPEDSNPEAIRVGQTEFVSEWSTVDGWIDGEDEKNRIEVTHSQTFFLDPSTIPGVMKGQVDTEIPATGQIAMMFFVPSDFADEADADSDVDVNTYNNFKYIMLDVAKPIAQTQTVEITTPRQQSTAGDDVDVEGPSITIGGFIYDSRTAGITSEVPYVEVIPGEENGLTGTYPATVTGVEVGTDNRRKFAFTCSMKLGVGRTRVTVRARNTDKEYTYAQVDLNVTDSNAIAYWSPLVYGINDTIKMLNLAGTSLTVGTRLDRAPMSRTFTMENYLLAVKPISRLGFSTKEMESVGGLTLWASGKTNTRSIADNYAIVGEEPVWIQMRSSVEWPATIGSFYAKLPGSGIDTMLFISNPTSAGLLPKIVFYPANGGRVEYDLGGNMNTGAWRMFSLNDIAQLPVGTGAFELENVPVAASIFFLNGIPFEIPLKRSTDASQANVCPYYSTSTSGSHKRYPFVSLYNPSDTATASIELTTSKGQSLALTLAPRGSRLLDLLSLGVPAEQEGGFTLAASTPIFADTWMVSRHFDTNATTAYAENLWSPVLDRTQAANARVAYMMAYTRLNTYATSMQGNLSEAYDSEYDTKIALYNTSSEPAYPKIILHRNDLNTSYSYDTPVLFGGEQVVLSLKNDILPYLEGTSYENMEGWIEIANAKGCAKGVWIFDEVSGRDYICPVRPVQ